MFWKHKLRKSVVCTCSKRMDMKPLRAAFAELQISQNRDWDAERRDGGLRPDCAVNWDEKSGKVPVTYLAGWCPLMTSGGPAWCNLSGTNAVLVFLAMKMGLPDVRR